MQKYIIALAIAFLPAWAFSQCATDGWLSCETSINPNPDRSNSHWIQYDFGATYALLGSKIWNYNDFSNVDAGIREFVIDYSLDGVSWTEWGTYELAAASGLPSYTGEVGPDLTGVTARYLLITAVSNFGADCYGLAEIKIDVDQSVATIELDESGDMRFTLSPNPVTDLAQLQFTSSSTADFRVTVFDGFGRLVFTKASGYGGLLSLDVENLPSGVYHLRVEQDQKFISGSFVKQ